MNNLEYQHYIAGELAGKREASNRAFIEGLRNHPYQDQVGRSLADIKEIGRLNLEIIDLNEKIREIARELNASEQRAKLWEARYRKEGAGRRGWQFKGMSAREAIQKLANTDRDGAEALIAQAEAEHTTKITEAVEMLTDRYFDDPWDKK